MPFIRGEGWRPAEVDRSTLFPPASVTFGSKVVEVENTRDTPTASHFTVYHPKKVGEVRLFFARGIYSCITCKAVDCYHTAIARLYVAGQQPLDLGATGPANGNPRPF